MKPSRTPAPPDRFCGVCVCGQTAWAILTKGYVTIVDPEDAHFLVNVLWHAVAMNVRHSTMVYAVAPTTAAPADFSRAPRSQSSKPQRHRPSQGKSSPGD